MNRFLYTDLIAIQRTSFYSFLERGLIEETAKINPIVVRQKNVSLSFYPEYYVLTRPEYSPKEAINCSVSYTSKLYMPVAIRPIHPAKNVTKSNKWQQETHWICLGDIPLMTKQGHFILNGAARIIVNQIVRSPGIYFKHVDSETNVSVNKTSLTGVGFFGNSETQETKRRYYADFICTLGTWLRLETDYENNIWVKMKKTPKLPIYWFLLAMGLSDKQIFNTIKEGSQLIQIHDTDKPTTRNAHEPNTPKNQNYDVLFTPEDSLKTSSKKEKKQKKTCDFFVNTPIQAWQAIYDKITQKPGFPNVHKKQTALVDEGIFDEESSLRGNGFKGKARRLSEANQQIKAVAGRNWMYNRFMNPRTYNLGKPGRYMLNRKLGLRIKPTHTTLTGLDVLYATNYLIKVVQGVYKTDDIDHLKNRRVRTAGELVQMQFSVALVRLEKSIKQNIHKIFDEQCELLNDKKRVLKRSFGKNTLLSRIGPDSPVGAIRQGRSYRDDPTFWTTLINNKAFNSAMREFFGTNPLSQFLDQINPLAELTHKRRISSMGPGGVTSSAATLQIRGIHPTHYGRICPVETPEGQNTGLVQSITTFARVNKNGFLESPYYRVYKGQIQKNEGMYFFIADQEENMKLAAADINVCATCF